MPPAVSPVTLTSPYASEQRVSTPLDPLDVVVGASPIPEQQRVDTQVPNTLLTSSTTRTTPLPPVSHSYRTRSATTLVGIPADNSAQQATLAEEDLVPSPLPCTIASITRVRSITHLAHANGAAATALNLNVDGTPLTYRSAKLGPDRDRWQAAEDAEISRLLETPVMFPRLPSEQPPDRRGDTTYYNPQTKEKVTADEKVYRIRGTIGGDRINYSGATQANTAAMPVVKMLLQSAVSEDANFTT
jgi:hypothetical protein